MEKFYRAVAAEVADPHVMVLTMITVTKPTVIFLQQCFERHWITDLVLSTSVDNHEIIESVLADYKSHLSYAVNDNVIDTTSHMVLYSEEQAISISGPMLNVASNHSLLAYTLMLHRHYGGFTSKECGNPLLNILLPDIMRHRQCVMRTDREKKSERIKKFLNFTFPPYPDED